MPDSWSKNFFSKRALASLKQRRSPSRSARRYLRRTHLAETLESRRLLAVVAFNESVDGDFDSDTSANIFTLDSTGTNSWIGTLESPSDLADGFQLELAPGTSVTDIRLVYTDADEINNLDQDVRFNASPLFDHSVTGSESVSAGSFSTLNPTLPITNIQFVNQLLADVLVDATDVVPAGSWSIEIDTVDANLPPQFVTAGVVLVPENQVGVLDLEAVDDDDAENAGLTYGISGGDDAALFTIDTVTGQLDFLTAPDFENPTDLDLDNLYEVTVDVTDSSMESDSLDVMITVEDV
ncbi:MAG: cadherin repeat domain-containing protein, partial [Planctomycetota bacterium]